MESFGESRPARERFASAPIKPGVLPGKAKPWPQMRTPLSYKVCDGLTEGLIYFSVVFSPWAFGTTQDWSIWTMNVTGYVLGAVLMAKWLIRWIAGYKPSRWGQLATPEQIHLEEPQQKVSRLLTVALAVLSVLVLFYSLIAALNPRSNYLPRENRFEYFDYIKWLPHSYDSAVTWKAFWSYLGLAFFFGALRDWLLGKSRRERREVHRQKQQMREESEDPSTDFDEPELETGLASQSHPLPISASQTPQLPGRLRRLLWVLCINGALLGLQGTLQRLDGTDKLLWLVKPRFTNTDGQFGPYAYRANGAQYLNLIWPVCLGFWLALRKTSLRRHRTGPRVGGGSYMVLLPCAVVMASAPVISTSRGGALIALGLVPAASALLFFAARREGSLVRASMLSVFLVILAFSGYLGWKQLAERLENAFVDNLSGRTEIYVNARAIARDFPVLGTGPGTFPSIYQLYKEPSQTWEAYLHDDWLETRITFGWVGFSLILAMLGLVLLHWWVGAAIPSSWEFLSFIWLALAGCLTHAKFDFPFQIYSTHFLFLLVCSILFCLSRK